MTGLGEYYNAEDHKKDPRWFLREEARLVSLQEHIPRALEDIAREKIPWMALIPRTRLVYDSFIDGYRQERDIQRRESVVHTEKRVEEGIYQCLAIIEQNKQDEDYRRYLKRVEKYKND